MLLIGHGRVEGDAAHGASDAPAMDSGVGHEAVLPVKAGGRGELFRLEVSSAGRSLISADSGAPFFWLADSAWYMTSITPAEVETYMQTRAKQGFTVIQGPIVIRAPFHQPLRANFRGDLPFANRKPMRLDEAYFEHIDAIIEAAARHGLYIAVPVIWGPQLDQVFSVSDPGELYEFGLKLGRRYADHKHVLWIVCGEYHKVAWETEKRDRTAPTVAEIDLIRQLAHGLEEGHGGAHLMTVHPDGHRSSSEHFQDAPWLGFHMIQTYSITDGTADLVYDDYGRDPPRPTLNAEPAYEGRDDGASYEPITAGRVRYEAYHSVFDGAFGHTYGGHGVWNFADGWSKNMKLPGAGQMVHLRRLMESRPASGRVPDRALVGGPLGDYGNFERITATRTSDGGYALVHIPRETLTATLDLRGLAGTQVDAWWYNPRDGEVYDDDGTRTDHPFGKFSTSSAATRFSPPGSDAAADWVLVLDSADRSFPPPGRARR